MQLKGKIAQSSPAHIEESGSPSLTPSRKPERTSS